MHAVTGALFVAILRKGPIEVIREIKALADKASENSDEDMAWSHSGRERTVHSTLGGNDSDITVGSGTSDESMREAWA